MENPLYDYATGSAQPQITIDNIKNVPILIPKLEDLQKLNSFLEGIYNFQWKITCENNSLTSLRDTLLPRLMSGELKINDISV
jgi:type I restriction enzyme S subunit